ncbi:hypothetical protein CBP27_14970 [Fischerella thermalis WC542]|uniref:hypothetical protein n=1 Tax=Fischerella thermalis TaxID=372787 RepID=UPI000C80B87A|nr:hypothetical protein [Fischerella thermalis]PLZ27689.1 hypothetical protein CBP28_12615 [Fischerella thermalis WC559]PLZ29825.1 hypothetical protein CBP10_14365 [Fischerella thermalis WC558]PLZ34873.1 hypothetical protein CBP27_14970 [Fischerella thermalis WC542]PLZ47640.1 hypothetical protein CBP15_20275 [Fischerella thermalis WC442]PLZ56874.1 hypothetical protein CBP24_11135 [Fischerella thermalis WC439]
MSNKHLRLIKCSGDKLKKIEPNIVDWARQNESPDEPIAVTVKVAEDGYIPNFVNLRAQISPKLFTATVTETDLHRLEADPRVISLGTPRRLHATI